MVMFGISDVLHLTLHIRGRNGFDRDRKSL